MDVIIYHILTAKTFLPTLSHDLGNFFHELATHEKHTQLLSKGLLGSRIVNKMCIIKIYL